MEGREEVEDDERPRRPSTQHQKPKKMLRKSMKLLGKMDV
jgi:hypothetical protein